MLEPYRAYGRDGRRDREGNRGSWGGVPYLQPEGRGGRRGICLVFVRAGVWQIHKWLGEDSAGIYLSGKLGGAFATAHFAQGGADTAIMDILGMMLVKGMLVYSGGGSYGLPFIHHGPVALDKVGNHYDESRSAFRIFGSRFAGKARELFS